MMADPSITMEYSLRSAPGPVMTCAELAAMMGCQESTIETRARLGHLPGLKFGTSWVFPTEATLRSINEAALREAGERYRKVSELGTVTHTFKVGGAVPPNLSGLGAMGAQKCGLQ